MGLEWALERFMNSDLENAIQDLADMGIYEGDPEYYEQLELWGFDVE